MNKGNGSIARTNKAELMGGLPVFGATNGLTVVAGLVELGGANPLIHNTTVNHAGFRYQHLSAGQDIFTLDPSGGLYSLGDIGGIVNGTHIVLNDATQTAGIFTSLFGGPAALLLSNGLGTSEIGDIGNVVNNTKIIVDDTIRFIELMGGPNNVLKFDIAAPKLDLTFNSNLYLNVDKSTDLYQFGDINGSNQGSTFQMNDANGVTWIVISTGVRLLLDTLNSIYAMGDVGIFGNGTYIEINDAAQTFNVNSSGGPVYVVSGVPGSEAAAMIGTTVGSQIGFSFNGTASGISIFDDTNNPFILLSHPSTSNDDTYIENFAGELRLTENTKATGMAILQSGRTIFGAMGTADSGVSSIQSSDSIATSDPGGGIGNWRLGIPIVAASALDGTRYVEVDINGSIVKLAVIV